MTSAYPHPIRLLSALIAVTTLALGACRSSDPTESGFNGCKVEPGIPDDYGYGEYGGRIDVGPPGQTGSIKQSDNDTCACDRKSLPPNLGAFLNCFRTDLAAWGVNLTLEDDTVVTAAGERYPRQRFRSEFASEVLLEVKDIERATIINDAYEDHLRPVLDPDPALRSAMQWWILRYYRFFTAGEGTLDDFTVDYTKQLSLYDNLAPLNRGGAHFGAFKAFMEQVVHGYRAAAHFPAKQPGARPVVRIVTGPYGGGHASVASTANTTLGAAFDAKTIDECRAFAGPLDTATAGKYRACLLYNDVEIKEANSDKASLLGHLNWLLSFYILPDQRGALRRALAADGTDLVFSTVHHLWDITAVGTAIARPTLIAITDFSFPGGQYFDVNHVNAKLVQYLLPSTQREFFRPMMLDYYAKSWEARVGSARTAYLRKQLFEGTGAPVLVPTMLAEIGVFNPMGFPVNAAMRPPADRADVDKSKQLLALGTNPNRKVLSIALGASPEPSKVQQLLELFLRQRDHFSYPIQLGLVTGGNAAVSDLAIPFFQKNGIPVDSSTNESEASAFPDKMTARVFPRLSQEEISDLYRATDAYVSKAGGATAAEVIACGTRFVRGFGLWPWEYENALWLAKLGLSSERPAEPANPLDLDTSFLAADPSADQLVTQVNDTLAKPRFFGPVPGALQFDGNALRAIVSKMIGVTVTGANIAAPVAMDRTAP